jgi:hypothetical protein
MAANSLVYMPFGGDWIDSLEIPIHEAKRMSTKPLIWLRFVCNIIINSSGHLYSDLAAADLHEAGTEIDYNSDVIGDEYYYLPG